jgi:hypothetical protein
MPVQECQKSLLSTRYKGTYSACSLRTEGGFSPSLVKTLWRRLHALWSSDFGGLTGSDIAASLGAYAEAFMAKSRNGGSSCKEEVGEVMRAESARERQAAQSDGTEALDASCLA